MAELVYALDSGSNRIRPVRVQVSLSPPYWNNRIDTKISVLFHFIGLWEQLNSPDFNRVEFDTFRSEAGRNYFTMTPKKRTDGVNAIGIVSKAGKYNGGTCAHKDAALRFASWIPLGICCSPCSNLLSTHYLKFEQVCRFRIFFTLTIHPPDKWDSSYVIL